MTTEKSSRQAETGLSFCETVPFAVMQICY